MVRLGRSGVKAQLLAHRDCQAALAFLERSAERNLFLMEMAAAVAQPPPPTEMAPRVVAAWEGRELVGVASLRPSVVMDADMQPEVLDACLPYLGAFESGLIKSERRTVAPLWDRLVRRGRRAMIDRGETGYRLVVKDWTSPVSAPKGDVRVRPAVAGDLEALVFAARASLREEDRPDPFDGDPVGFRRWVRGRVARARVVEAAGQVVFVGYADVRRSEGWLIQGVYTWPEARRQGYAALGMASLAEEAARAGADHVQLAVVEGNTPAIGLYRGLGFEPFSELRTILFG